MKRVLIVTLTLLLILTPFLVRVTVRAQTSASIYTVPDYTSVPVGSDVMISIDVSDVENLYGYDVNITYDNRVLSCLNATVGDLFPQYLTFEADINDAAGYLRYAITLKSPEPPINGTGDILDIGFNAFAVGTSPLNFASVILDNSSALPLDYTATDGSIDVYNPGETKIQSFSTTTSQHIDINTRVSTQEVTTEQQQQGGLVPGQTFMVNPVQASLSLGSGRSADVFVGVSWTLLNSIIVKSITFTGLQASWVHATLPATLSASNFTVPLTVTVPSGTPNGEYAVSGTMTIDGGAYGPSSAQLTLTITVQSGGIPSLSITSDPAGWAKDHALLVIFVIGAIVALAWIFRKK